MARDRSLDIAVTGISARFPGSKDLDAWWAALTSGTVLTTRYDRAALLAAGVPAALADDPDYVPVRGHLDGADRFDNTLFRVSAREAQLMDPQHRLMLEAAWAALEDAGAGRSGEGPRTGVYASSSGSGYLRSLVAGRTLDPATLDQVIHGTEPDFMASRIAYKLGLTGPAMAVQTACSSSLVGVHLAVQALVAGDCDQAVVVAAGLGFPQAGHLCMPGGIQSAAGSCRPFDARADGVVAGSGVVCVVLRRLADALDDGPSPYGIILGTAINNDGAAKAGYHAPSVAGQEAVIRSALGAADVGGESIGYLEAHATGTRVGDPIEWSAASAALKGMGAGPGQVAVGALKANIGHLDAAAGLAALVKALLVVRDGIVPPVAGFTRLNPLLETGESPLRVPEELAAWTGPLPRRAGVSAFGIGGTNAHVIIEQPPTHHTALSPLAPFALDLWEGTPAREGTPAHHNAGIALDRFLDEPSGLDRQEEEPAQLVLVSAADREALDRAARRLAGHLTARAPELADVSFTLATGRAELPERLAVTGRTAAEVALALSDGAARGRRPTDGPAPVVFLFPGQGSQRPGMAVPFARSLPGFPSALAACLDCFTPELAERVERALLDPAFPADDLRETELAQPSLFALEHAAATALMALGVRPASLIGHSLGEITAACLAGVFTLPDAARFVAVRGSAMQGCPAGAMIALGCPEAQGMKLAAEAGVDLELAAVNSADSCVLGGTVAAVERFELALGDKVFHRRLRTSHAFHTRLVQPAVPELAMELTDIRLRRPVLPYAANSTGRVIPAGVVVSPETFIEQARHTVRYAEAMASTALSLPGAVAIEIGPGTTLSALAANLVTVPLSPGRASTRPADEVLNALGRLWTLGQPVDPRALCGVGQRVHLPTYPFAGPRWVAPEAAAQDLALSVVESPSWDEVPADRATDAPAVLAGLWAELLGQSDLTAESDFFQLGGDSLLITSLARKVNQELGIRVPIRSMLAGRTLGRQTTIVLDLLAEPVAAAGP
ncbi:type I polyketide synthase [Nonomuraea endophytica]|uniref:Acyl transferase domain-containing protein n=1 Tax=Nonomuraea endophytica TaxID=714136 RepID=A0A7W8EGL9_9ACTN|nr:type I polyketide synthase [Nonomuraea endophytica]MBB5078744.1 acyl transferase domain-containing protein [Nonomuraea endophytica]